MERRIVSKSFQERESSSETEPTLEVMVKLAEDQSENIDTAFELREIAVDKFTADDLALLDVSIEQMNEATGRL